MQLARTERWILANQYRILESLDLENADYYKEAQVVLERGYELHYGWLAERVYQDKDTMKESECLEVLDILSMFEALQNSFRLLQDKSDIDDWRAKFTGFDGNYETSQLAYASFYCSHDGGHFRSLDHPDDFNSHCPTLERYRRMLACWNRVRKDSLLAKEQIQEIISA